MAPCQAAARLVEDGRCLRARLQDELPGVAPRDPRQVDAGPSSASGSPYVAAMPIFFLSSASESAPALGDGPARARSISSSMVPPTSASWS